MNPLISIIIWTNSTDPVFFRECILSILAQEYEEYEIVVLDENEGREAAAVCEELLASDPRLNFKKLTDKKGAAHAINIGLHRKNGKYVFFMGQHDRLAKKALSSFVEELAAHPDTEIIYSDWDELVGEHRANPAFLPGFNVELLRHMDYIRNACLFSVDVLKRIGTLNTRLSSSAIYELLLRGSVKRAKVRHIPKLLYHIRVSGDLLSATKQRQLSAKAYREYLAVATSHLQHVGVDASAMPDSSREYWRIKYNGEDAAAHRSEYRLVREKGVVARRSGFVERMYGILKQSDVGIVGVRFENGFFSIENCGYFFDENGDIISACGGQSIFSRGYLNWAVLPHDVSMVDAGLFMIDTKVLDRVGGFDMRLSGQAQMLDLCLKVISAGKRVVIEPNVLARRKGSYKPTQNEESASLLREKWGEVLSEGDPFFNKHWLEYEDIET